jgi:hypothetical protein
LREPSLLWWLRLGLETGWLRLLEVLVLLLLLELALLGLLGWVSSRLWLYSSCSWITSVLLLYRRLSVSWWLRAILWLLEGLRLLPILRRARSTAGPAAEVG